jgi:gliding motility-associated-like protein
MMNLKYSFYVLISFFTFIANAQNVTLTGPVACNGAAVSGSWTVPCNVTAITIQVYGGGGGAGGGGGGSNGGLNNTQGGGGAGGGGYTTITINVVPNSSFSYSIGAGGCGGSNGSDLSSGGNGSAGSNTTFTGTAAGGAAVSLTANGGARGNAGSTSNNGSGGNGGSASGGSTNTSGGNGSGGSGANGGSGGNGAGPSGGAGGAATNNPGLAIGGGGAGGGNSTGGRGAAGGILITYVTTTPLPATPLISSTAATCTVAGSSSISNYDASLPYTFSPTGPTVGAGGVISGMVIGTSYTVVVGTIGCTSAPSASFSNAAVAAPPAIPTITSTAPSCIADGSSTISNYNASFTYTFTPSGPTAGVAGAISGMTIGTNYTVIANNGSCNSNASTSFSNSAQLATPAIPSITSTPATCTTSGSSVINNYVASQTYTFTPSGPAVGAGGAISGMTLGTSYTVVAANSTCSSNASASFSNAVATAPPAAPTITSTAPSCTADGNSTISNYNASFTYAFTPSGPTAGAAGAISGMMIGTNYTVIANDGSCNSVASNNFSNSAQLVTPAIPSITSTPATCTSNGSSTISNYDAALTYSFTPSGPTVGVGGAISGMILGTSYTVVAANSTCSSNASASFSNAVATAPPVAPTITSTAPSCTADGNSTISNYNASFTYAFTPAGPTAGAGGAISGMTIGTSYTVIANDGSCNSVASSNFSNSAQLIVPMASISGNLTYCIGNNTTLTASGGSSYEWVDASANNVGNTASVTVTQGTYTVTVTGTNSCTASAVATVTELSNLAVSITGDLEYCPTKNTTITASGGTSYVWSNSNTSDNITVTQGTYTVTASDLGCTGTASAIISERTVSAINLGNDTTLCTDSLLIIDASANFVSYNWSNGATTQTISPITSGTYAVTATDTNGCETSKSIVITFNSCLVDEEFILIPTAFSPNNDGNNDLFRYRLIGDVEFIDIRIFNRWGERMFYTSDDRDFWDGRYKDVDCPLGVYIYEIRVRMKDKKTKSHVGNITLIR